MTQPLSTWTEAAWQSAQAQIPAPESLQKWRGQQLQEFLKRGFPQRNDENWKYTSIAALIGQEFSIPAPRTQAAQIDLSAYRCDNCYRIVFIDGVFSLAHSQYEDLPKNVLLTGCSEAMIGHADVNQQPLSVFHWLNGALMGDGLFLSIPENVEIQKPIHLLYLTTANSHGASMRHPRHILQLGANSRVSVLEEYSGLGCDRYFNNVMTKISLGANARLDYYKLQRESADAFHIANTLVEQSRDSQIRAYHIGVGARLNREDLNFSLRQAGADCELSGFYSPQAQQHIDFHTRIDHHHSHTHSRQYYKGMIGAQGRGVFNGKIIVHPQAQKITAHQENHNLLLAESAEIDTKPELEVFADNVQCTHGATVGNLDSNALFYLRSRGVPEELARRLLMNGFAREILDRLPHSAIAQYVQKAVGDCHYA